MKQKRFKKAQGLSFNVIVIAALALITLLVVLGIFTGKFGEFSKDIKSCAIKGGTCKELCGENEREFESATCPKTISESESSKTKKCCIKIAG